MVYHSTTCNHRLAVRKFRWTSGPAPATETPPKTVSDGTASSYVIKALAREQQTTARRIFVGLHGSLCSPGSVEAELTNVVLKAVASRRVEAHLLAHALLGLG